MNVWYSAVRSQSGGGGGGGIDFQEEIPAPEASVAT